MQLLHTEVQTLEKSNTMSVHPVVDVENRGWAKEEPISPSSQSFLSSSSTTFQMRIDLVEESSIEEVNTGEKSKTSIGDDNDGT